MKIKQKQLRFLLFVYLLSQVAFYCFAPLYALFANDVLHITLRSIGLIWSGYSLLTALFIFLLGRLENKQRKGRMILLGFLLYTVSSACLAAVHSEIQLIVALAVNALAAGVTFPAYKTLFAHSETRGKESEQWAWLDAGNMFSSAIGASIGGLVVATFSFRTLFITMAGMQFTAVLVAYHNLYRAN